jgi:hypothetical protein
MCNPMLYHSLFLSPILDFSLLPPSPRKTHLKRPSLGFFYGTTQGQPSTGVAIFSFDYESFSFVVSLGPTLNNFSELMALELALNIAL